MSTESDYKLVNVLAGQTDTDYRVLNGKDRPIYRINVKFFGSLFLERSEWLAWFLRIAFP